MNEEGVMQYAPRIMRPEEACYYCGVGRNLFDQIFRPMLPVISLGDRGIGFDRLDLDEAIAIYKASHSSTRDTSCQKSADSIGTHRPAKGLSKSRSEAARLQNALAQVRENRPKRSITPT